MLDKNINIMTRDELAAHRTALLSEMSGIKNRAEARLGRIEHASRRPTRRTQESRPPMTSSSS